LQRLAPASPRTRLAADLEAGGAASRTLQVVYPWLITPSARDLPGGLEPPDGPLAGVLARSVLARGAHFSLGRQPLRGVTGFQPPLEPEEIAWSGPPLPEDALIDRLTLLGPSAAGPRVLSDVNTSLLEAFRPGGVERLTLAILRAARRLAEELVFDHNGPVLWRRVTRGLETLLTGFFELGAFRGETAADAFQVQCDATTTTQNDLDAGRVVAQVRFAPAGPVNWITVVLTLNEGGRAVALAGA
jgi:phage tail sheath protein FI